VEREQARQATATCYANRIIGGTNWEPVYQGDFDYLGLANRLPIPDSESLADHQRAWKVLWAEFDRCWSLYARM